MIDGNKTWVTVTSLFVIGLPLDIDDGVISIRTIDL
jgi:hypothetical protein